MGNVDIWAMDEVHFQQYGSACRMWIPPEEKNPVILHHPTRKGVGYFGAVRLRDGKFVFARETDIFNAQTAFDFFRQFSDIAVAEGRRVQVIIDNARFHHAKLHKDWRAENDATFHLEYLPSYSPDLNPIERVWKLVRRLCCHNQYFPTLMALIDRIEDQFKKWINPNDTLRTLCAIK